MISASYLYYYNNVIPPQITEKLLEAEERKLRVLKAEIEASKHSDAARDSSKVKSTLSIARSLIMVYYIMYLS